MYTYVYIYMHVYNIYIHIYIYVYIYILYTCIYIQMTLLLQSSLFMLFSTVQWSRSFFRELSDTRAFRIWRSLGDLGGPRSRLVGYHVFIPIRMVAKSCTKRMVETDNKHVESLQIRGFRPSINWCRISQPSTVLTVCNTTGWTMWIQVIKFIN